MLSKKEQEELLEKIRCQYEEYAQQYGSGAFDLKAFNRRYTHVLVNRQNMEAFLLAEIAFFEKLIETFENSAVQKLNSLDAKFEKIALKQQEKWEKYEKFNFHPYAELETKYFFGALNQFSDEFLQVIYILFKGTPEILALDKHIREMEKIGKNNPRYSTRMQNHIYILETDRTKGEKDKQHLLKDSANILYSFSCKLESLMSEMTSEYLDSKFTTNNTEFRELYKDKTIRQVLQSCIAFALNIIDDFRLNAFIKK